MTGFQFKQIIVAATLLVAGFLTFGCAPDKSESASFGASASEPAISTKTLTISETTSDSTVVSWTKATNNGVADTSFTYQVYYSTVANIYDLATTKTNGTPFGYPVEDINSKTITGLGLATGYFFNVVAANTAGNGAAYSMAVATTTDGSTEVPTETATSIAFTDSDQNGDEIQGTLTIGKAADESSITHYALYWGVSSDSKVNGEAVITEAQVTGADLAYTFAADTAVPDSATNFLVYSKNAKGEMSTGIALAFTDAVTPGIASSLSFTDIDLHSGEVQGTVNIGKSTDETDVANYVLYYGSAADTKLSGQLAIATLAKTGSDLSFGFGLNTPLQAGATHLLVYTDNGTTEQTVPKATVFTDVAIPIHAAAGVSFTDTDQHASEIGGAVSITKATDESDVTSYVIYWGTNSTTKMTATAAIATIAATGGNVSYTIPTNTAVPSGGTHLLVYSTNAVGEMETGINVAITDKAVPIYKATTVCWDDIRGGGDIQGTVSITSAAIQTGVTGYTLYWSNDGSIPTGTAIASITAPAVSTGATMYTFARTTPTATHFVVVSYNADGEMDTGTGIGPVDGLTTTPDAVCP